MIEPYDWRAMAERTMIGAMVHFTLKPMFETDVLSDKIDLRDDNGVGLLIIFSKDKNSPPPSLVMETIKFSKSGDAEMIGLDCFGMDCGLEVAKNAVTSMIFERCKRIEIKEDESDDDTNA